MTLFGAPLSTLLPAGAAAAAALVGLYLLRPSRRRIEVPYARLWGLVAKEARSTATSRRLRRWESLLLQLVIAALILLALADPRAGTRGHPRHVILVDVSASMQAKDGAESRIARARRAALQVIDGLDSDEEAILVGFDSRARPLTSLTRDDAQLRQAARQLGASDSAGELLPALRFAADALRGAPSARITLIGDGAYDSVATPLPGADLRFISVSSPPASDDPPSHNVAITGFAVRRYTGNPSAYEILIELRSYADQPRRVHLSVTQEGETVDVSDLELPPRGRVQRRLADLSGEGRRLEASLEIEGGDALALDDHAYALIPERRRSRVLLVGEGSLYTEGALLLDRAVELDRKRPAQYDAGMAARYDAIVFDGFVPSAPPPRPTLYLGCEGEHCPVKTKGAMSAPLVTETEREHPILRFIALKDLNVSRSAIFVPEKGDVALASSLGRPLLVAGERAGQRLVALGFSPSASDLPLRVAFPVLLVNALDWLEGRSVEPVEGVRTGHAARLPAQGEAVQLRCPRGERRTLPVRDGRVELIAEQAGFYQLGSELIAANLADPRESSIAARRFTVNGQALAGATPVARVRPRASPWRWLAALALLLVLLEWWTYHRRHTV